MKLNLKAIEKPAEWEKAGFTLPSFNCDQVRVQTRRAPRWLHVGAGNIFRAFPAAVLQDLLDRRLTDTGLIVAECFDGDIIDAAYAPFDCLSVLCVLKSDGAVDKRVIASVTEALRCDGKKPIDDARLREIMTQPSLQMVSFTVTEKGYAVMDASGRALPMVQRELDAPPAAAKTTVGKIAAGLLARFEENAAPIALVSMDNCSHNGDKLRAAVLYIAEGWREHQYVGKDFIRYLTDNRKVAFPISMIDKITPRPDEKVAKMLADSGLEGAAPFMTEKHTYTAAYVNAEETQYLVVENAFPAGRPPLDKAGVFFVDRETVDKAEKMKVCTCLNPLHTALAVLGCLLDYRSICDEMRDEDLNALVRRIVYREAMPVVVDPGILSPADFAREVLEKRFPNPFMPDTPQRIATDTSQKLPIRYGETLKAYAARADLHPEGLRCIPFVLAAWLRYLMAVDDKLSPFTPSPDPMLDEMQSALAFLQVGRTVTSEQLAPVLARDDVFGVDLNALGLAAVITRYLNGMLAGKGAVRAALRALLQETA